MFLYRELPRTRSSDRNSSTEVAAELGKPMRPGDLLFVPDLPKTRNAKVMRRVIRSAWLGEDPGDTSSLVNPEAIAAIAEAAAKG